MDDLSCALFPSSCRLCGDSLLRLSRTPVCDTCLRATLPQTATLCLRCGEALGIPSFSLPLYSDDDPRTAADRLCQPCRLAPPPFEKAAAYGVYQDQLRELLHLLKYAGVQSAANHLGALLAVPIADVLPANSEPLLVVPVPLHRSKRRTRGFNHAELLARAAIAVAVRRHPGLQLRLATGLLERKRATQSQAGLSPHERRRNLRGVFSVPQPSRVAGRHILLIDDIYTTGATARACSQALLRAGAASVRVATVARAQREGVAFWDPAFIADTGSELQPASAARPTRDGQLQWATPD